MRRGRNESTWKNEEGQVIALNLGADYCAEHEWGIKGLQYDLGIPSSDLDKEISPSLLVSIRGLLSSKKNPKLGIERRTITESKCLIDNLSLGPAQIKEGHRRHKMWGIALIADWMHERWDFSNIRDSWWDPERSEFMGWWSDRDLAVLHPDKQVIQDFVDAFEKKDIAVWVGASGPFQNGGLIIAIVSRLPQEFLEEAISADLDYIALKKAAISTGIYERLEKAGCKYFALSPKWKDDERKEVKFWLNPMDQRNNNFGWYSVKDLEEWCNGTGPILKNK